jgi:hypothetical protein
MAHTKLTFGREVLGPIFAEFALRLWIYVSNLAQPEDTALLFCARGGLRMQLLYDRFLTAAGLDSPVHTSALMISRVVAVRPALLANANSAYEQIGYEFSGARVLDAAKAVSGVSTLDADAPAEWRAPYSRQGLEKLLASREGQFLRQNIHEQTERFRTHSHACAGERRRIVISDTGLFGSTLQLLKDGMPELSWSSVVIARSNYKRMAAPHFPHMVGLSLEDDEYCPWRPRTSLLRYWHLVESTFEPDLPSVTRFVENGGSPRSNLEIDGWKARIAPEPGSLFAGVLDYVDNLPHAPAIQILTDADAAWSALRQAIVWPGSHESRILDAGRRSDDFGREQSSSVARPWRGPLAALRGSSMWREGEIARSASPLRTPLLLAIETAYGLRWCRRNAAKLLC